MTISDKGSQSKLSHFKLCDLFRGIAPRIVKLILNPDCQNLRTGDLRSVLDLFANLPHLDISLFETYERKHTDAFPSHLRELAVVGDYHVIKQILVRLANPQWLPSLCRVPVLRGTGFDGYGNYEEECSSQPYPIVARAILGLRKRGGVMDLAENIDLLNALIDSTGENTDDEWESDLEDPNEWLGET